ncbi:MAG: FAD-dependent thymidylate synthase [Candidatus Methanofastidiosia archaeon]
MINVRVVLLSYTPDPERVCAAAALSTYWYKGASQTYDKLSKGEIGEILEKVIGYGHVSVIEHASFTFSIEDVSRACTHQLVRHRLASYSQQSQRYVRIEGMTPVVPKSVSQDPAAKALFETGVDKAVKVYEDMIRIGIPKEDARFVLPQASKTNIVVTMNARELRHFFKYRCCERAQWEIREMAKKMLSLVKEIAPIIFKNAGPTCICEKYCPEGDLSCGRLKVKNDGKG